MSNKLSITNSILIISSLLFGCSEPVKEEKKNNASVSSLSLHVGNENYFIIDTKETFVEWKGSSVGGTHAGYVYISKGELMIENGQLMGGTAEVNMNTIEDEDHRSDNNLIEHLKNQDFFDVKKFPSSTITITKAESINGEQIKVTGNLSIKGITHPVSFPAKMEIKDGIVRANGRLVIDRTRWGIRYKSGKFFDNLKDEAISDSIEFNIKIVAKNK
jgi:polyisoprenoid-binding protein YceI